MQKLLPPRGRIQNNLSGRRFGRLIAVRPGTLPGVGRVLYLCRCDCGTERIAIYCSLVNNLCKSCGCLKREASRRNAAKNRTHGLSRTPEYGSWHAMVSRCSDPRDRQYPDYGGRGITVCERWQVGPLPFIEDMGLRPSRSHTLDRIDNDGNYEPSNCRWATKIEQQNNRRVCLFVTWMGETKTVTEWARDRGLNFTTLKYRLNSGWPVDDAMQGRRRRWGQRLTLNGQTMGIHDWAKKLGLKPATIYGRLSAGLSPQEALSCSLSQGVRRPHSGRK
jgi:hypothetical protein